MAVHLFNWATNEHIDVELESMQQATDYITANQCELKHTLTTCDRAGKIHRHLFIHEKSNFKRATHELQ